MRICYLAAGTGSFVCGTCNRDQLLARGLREAGHQVRMLPLYLPVRTDEEDLTNAPIFLGGINAFLQQHCAILRGSGRVLGGLFDWMPLLRLASHFSDMTKAAGMGPMTVSILDGPAGCQAAGVDRLLRWLERNVEADLVILSNLMFSGLAAPLRQTLRAPVICQMGGEDGFLNALPPEWSRQAWGRVKAGAPDIDAYVSVSRFFADMLVGGGLLPADKVRVVHPGIALDGYAPATEEPRPPVLGFLSHLIPIKGLHTVIDAFLLLREKGWPDLQLHVAGAANWADRRYVRQQRRRVRAAGVEQAVRWSLNCDRAAKQAFLRSCSVLAVAPNYPESFGMYCLEAQAAGVPVVVPRRGGLAEAAEATGGGLLYEPAMDGDAKEDAMRLAEPVGRLLADANLRRNLSGRGRAAVRERFGYRRMVEENLTLIEQVLDRAAAASARGVP